MPLTRRFIESARTTVRLRDGAGLLTCDDAVQRSRIPLPPPPLQGNGFHVFSARWGSGSRPPRLCCGACRRSTHVDGVNTMSTLRWLVTAQQRCGPHPTLVVSTRLAVGVLTAAAGRGWRQAGQ